MASTAIDRLDGLSSSAAIKGPCRVATTANITLSGLQTIDGVTLVADDRVLVKDQTNTVDNGIYIASVAGWRRSRDFYGARDVVQGTRVYITEGTDGAGTGWQVTTANPIVVGTSNITFADATLGTYYVPFVNALDFGISTTGTAGDNATALNAAIASIDNGVVFIPAGTYAMDDITIADKCSSPNEGRFEIDARGVIFTGGNDIIFDSSKRVAVNGLDAPTHVMKWRGLWQSDFFGVRIGDIVIGDTDGTAFSTHYWNNFHNGQVGSVAVHASATGACNANQFVGTAFRGDANQGFTVTRDYALELNGNVNCQALTFRSCDFSYYNEEIYSIGVGNTAGDIEVLFDRCYFDSEAPQVLDRSNGQICMRDCHVAGKFIVGGSLKGAARAGMQVWEKQHSVAWQPYMARNLIGNGDLARALDTYVGAGLPIGSSNSATITANTGEGPHGRYLNIDQALTTSNEVRFRGAVRMTGKHTGQLIIRNAGSGSKLMSFAVDAQYFTATISDSEWTFLTLSPQAELTAGNNADILIFTADATAFNVDVCYAGLVYGDAPPILVPSSPPAIYDGSATYNPPSLADGEGASTTVTVTGAALGDFAVASWGAGTTAGMLLNANVTASNTVTVRFQNETGGTLDLSSGTLRVRVFSRT